MKLDFFTAIVSPRGMRWSSAPPTARLAVALAGLLGLLGGCAPGTLTLVREGRFPEAWWNVCKREPSDYPAPNEHLSRDERAAFRERLAADTRGTFTARALSSKTLHERLGETIFPRDALVLVVHVEAPSHPGAGILVTPRLVIGGETWVQWWNRDVWALAQVEPPTPPSFGSYNIAGALLDAVVGGLTLGGIDPQFRGQKDILPSVSPGSPGTGTKLQQDVLFRLIDHNEQCSSVQPARIAHPCDAFFVMATGEPTYYPEVPPISVDEAPPPSSTDALLLQVEFKADRTMDAYCTLGYTIVLPLPSGPDPASRVNALFAKGPVELGAPSSPAAPAPSRAKEGR